MATIWRELKTRRFGGRFLTHAFAALGAIVVLLEIFSYLFPGDLNVQGVWWAFTVAVISVAYGLYRSWPRPIVQVYSSPNTTIRIVKGDLLAEPGHLVIGMSDTFDTKLPYIISPGSMQGQALQRLFGGDVDELDRRLDQELVAHTPVGIIEKPGKTQCYELGTVVILKDGTRRLFLLAYTNMNEHNQARSTPDGIWKSLLSLWVAVSQHGNGYSVAVPVIGGGQSRLAQVLPAQDSIRFIALSFMLASRTEKVCDELRIVVQPEVYARLDHAELQAFLSSLRPS